MQCREASEDSDGPPDLDPSARGDLDEADGEPDGSQGGVAGDDSGSRSRSPHRYVVDPSAVDGAGCRGHGRTGVATPCRNLILRSRNGSLADDLLACASVDGEKGNAPLWMPGFQDDALAQCHPADTSVAVAPAVVPEDMVDVGSPVTLLELASRSQAGAIVATTGSFGVSAKEVSGGRTISLHSCVPVPTFDLTRPTAAMQRSLQDVWELCQPWRVSLFSAFPDGFHPHPATCEALREAIAGPFWGHRPAQVRLYTDGSFDGHTSAWSFVVVGYVEHHIVAVQWAAAQVAVHHEHPDWLGADSHRSQQADASAFCVAAMWALQCFKSEVAALLSDSLTTVMRANGFWGFPSSDTLSCTCRSLAQALEVLDILPNGRTTHVTAHSGCPMNELADGLAKWMVTEKCPDLQTGLGVKEWIKDGSLQHLWLMLSAWRCPEYWPQHSLTSLVDDGIPTRFCDSGAASWCGINDQSAVRHTIPKRPNDLCVSQRADPR